MIYGFQTESLVRRNTASDACGAACKGCNGQASWGGKVRGFTVRRWVMCEAGHCKRYRATGSHRATGPDSLWTWLNAQAALWDVCSQSGARPVWHTARSEGNRNNIYLYLMIVSILQNVIRKILRRRPCENILPGVLCVTQGTGLPTGMSRRAACGWSQVALTPALRPCAALWPCTLNCSDPARLECARHYTQSCMLGVVQALINQ